MQEQETGNREQKTESQRGKQPGGKKQRKQQGKLDERLAGLEQQLQNLEEDLRRERADFTNFRRRSELDRSQIMAVAKTEIMQQLLPVFDDLDRALSHCPEELAGNDWVKGVSQIRKEVARKLSALGVDKIAAKGEKFDPERHEAIGFEDGDGEEEVVIEELRPGYVLGGEVMRPAMVRVGKQNGQQVAGSKQQEEKGNQQEKKEVGSKKYEERDNQQEEEE